MLGSGKSSGVVNEASNLLANQNLTNAVEEMSTKAYQKQRDLNDVIPTHRHEVPQPKKKEDKTPVFNPEAEKAAEKLLRQHDGAPNPEDDDDDDELTFLRERRLAAMRKNQEKEIIWRQKQHGSYREISQDDFFNIVVREKGGSDDVAVHLYHKDFERCKLMDRYLQDLAPAMMSVKIVKLDAERAPFLVEKLRVTTLPCVLLFHNDVNVDRIIGFDGCSVTGDTIEPDMLRLRIEKGLKMAEDE